MGFLTRRRIERNRAENNNDFHGRSGLTQCEHARVNDRSDHESLEGGHVFLASLLLLMCGVGCAVLCCAVLCGVVRCGAVRCGAVRCGAVRCGAVLAKITAKLSFGYKCLRPVVVSVRPTSVAIVPGRGRPGEEFHRFVSTWRPADRRLHLPALKLHTRLLAR